jgi:hypothetical protein
MVIPAPHHVHAGFPWLPPLSIDAWASHTPSSSAMSSQSGSTTMTNRVWPSARRFQRVHVVWAFRYHPRNFLR